MTATTRTGLRRVKDEDVVAMPDAKPTYNLNAKQRGTVAAATQIAKSRVQFTRE